MREYLTSTLSWPETIPIDGELAIPSHACENQYSSRPVLPCDASTGNDLGGDGLRWPDIAKSLLVRHYQRSDDPRAPHRGSGCNLSSGNRAGIRRWLCRLRLRLSSGASSLRWLRA